MRAIRVMAASAIIVAALAATGTAADPPRGGVIAAEITATWNCQTQLGVKRSKAGNPWRPHSAAYRSWQLNRWKLRHKSCTAALHERGRQWNWQAWLPRNWYLVGSCETGGGGDPNWFHHNRSYVSAFGIQRGAAGGQYDNDAAKVGMPPWNDRRPPSPWQQYQTALSHYRSFGDGWGCPGP